ncbi:MAG: hypothetical protein CVV03_08895 [Firmicutes bacterium HGW-Firmicutes-8]|nr:MAG: hypothetical protein CVV03_08895 [Firmicutes bacterium HGW-Firmicutes-8]
MYESIFKDGSIRFDKSGRAFLFLFIRNQVYKFASDLNIGYGWLRRVSFVSIVSQLNLSPCGMGGRSHGRRSRPAPRLTNFLSKAKSKRLAE